MRTIAMLDIRGFPQYTSLVNRGRGIKFDDRIFDIYAPTNNPWPENFEAAYDHGSGYGQSLAAYCAAVVDPGVDELLAANPVETCPLDCLAMWDDEATFVTHYLEHETNPGTTAQNWRDFIADHATDNTYIKNMSPEDKEQYIQSRFFQVASYIHLHKIRRWRQARPTQRQSSYNVVPTAYVTWAIRNQTGQTTLDQLDSVANTIQWQLLWASGLDAIHGPLYPQYTLVADSATPGSTEIRISDARRSSRELARLLRWTQTISGLPVLPVTSATHFNADPHRAMTNQEIDVWFKPLATAGLAGFVKWGSVAFADTNDRNAEIALLSDQLRRETVRTRQWLGSWCPTWLPAGGCGSTSKLNRPARVSPKNPTDVAPPGQAQPTAFSARVFTSLGGGAAA